MGEGHEIRVVCGPDRRIGADSGRQAGAYGLLQRDRERQGGIHGRHEPETDVQDGVKEVLKSNKRRKYGKANFS